MISSSILPTFLSLARHSPFVSRSVGSLMSFTSFPRPSGRDRRERNEGREGACLSGPFATLHSRSFHAPSHILLLSLHPRPSGSVPEEDVTVGSWRREERDTTEGRGRSFTPLRVSFIPVPRVVSHLLPFTSFGPGSAPRFACRTRGMGMGEE